MVFIFMNIQINLIILFGFTEKILSKITTSNLYVSKEDYNFSIINNFKNEKNLSILVMVLI